MRHLELWVNYYIRWNPRIKQQVSEAALLKDSDGDYYSGLTSCYVVV